MIHYRGYLLADLRGKSERRWAIFLPPSCIPKGFAKNHVAACALADRHIAYMATQDEQTPAEAHENWLNKEACRKVDGMIDNAGVRGQAPPPK